MSVNTELLHKVMDTILSDQDHWDQRFWAKQDVACGTSYCFAGWTTTLEKHEVDWTRAHASLDGSDSVVTGLLADSCDSIAVAATALLGLSGSSADVLFRSDNTLADLKHFVDLLCTRGYLLDEDVYASEGWVNRGQ